MRKKGIINGSHCSMNIRRPKRKHLTDTRIRIMAKNNKTMIFRVSLLSIITNSLKFSGYLSQYSDWLRAGGSGIEYRWGRDFPPVQACPVAHPASWKMGTGSFPGANCGRGVLLTTHPLLVPRSWKSRVILLPTLWVLHEYKTEKV